MASLYRLSRDGLSEMASIHFYWIIFVFGIACGWFVHGWKTDSEQLAAISAIEENNKKISATLEDKLSKLRANEREIIREIPKIIDRPIYSYVCLDDSGLLLINQSKGGSAKPAGQMH